MNRRPRTASPQQWRQQRREKFRQRPGLSLVALMDVFTILVFFFLAHSTDVTPQGFDELLHLPESVADQQPRDTTMVTITSDFIMLDGQQITTTEAAMQTPASEVTTLQAALQAQLAAGNSESVAGMSRDGTTEDIMRELTIMADKSIPFELLNRVMRSCARAGFGNISLSVQQRPETAG
jgi:biopolymer transport protein ExbD